MPLASVIRSASAGTRRTATCSSPTSARTSWKKSVSSRPAPTWAGTIGRAVSGSSAGRRSVSSIRKARPDSPIPSPSTGSWIRSCSGARPPPASWSTVGTRSPHWRTYCCSVTTPAARSSLSAPTGYRAADKMPSAGFCSTTTATRKPCCSSFRRRTASKAGRRPGAPTCVLARGPTARSFCSTNATAPFACSYRSPGGRLTQECR